ncbi:MAG: hypothetical protein ACI4XJ_03145 [Eubacteriales bacterium]
MFLWELKKLCGKFTLCFTAVMLCLTAVLIFLANLNTLTPAYDEICLKQEQLLYEYQHDRESYDAAFAEYTLQLEAYDEWMYQLRYGDGNPGVFVWQNRIIDTDDYGDRELFRDVESVIDRSKNYGAAIDRLLLETYKKLNDSGIRRGEFLYEYQVNTILRYEKLRSLEPEAHFTRGWNEYFSSEIPTVLLIVTVIGISVQTFLIEKRTRIYPILHTLKRGEIPLRCAKIASLFCISAALSVLFSLIPLSVYSLTTGLSDSAQLIQTLDGFLYCPYEISIMECLLLTVAGRIFAAFSLALCVSAIGQVSGSEIISCGTMLLFLVTQALTQSIGETSKYATLKRYNLFETVNFTVFFERYRAVNFFGIPISDADFVLSITAVILLCGVLATLFAKTGFRDSNLAPKLKKMFKLRTRKQLIRTYTPSVLLFEMKKLCLNRRIMCFLLAVTAARCIIAYLSFQPSAAAEDRILREYYSDIAALGGCPGDGTDGYIAAEAEYIKDCTAQYSNMMQAYYAGEISDKELREYTEKYNYAVCAQNALLKLDERRFYLRYMGETYTNLRYIYGEGLTMLLQPEIDFIYIMCLLTVIPPILSGEYQSGFASVQRTCMKGRRETFFVKLICAAGFAALVHLMFGLIDLGFYLSNFTLPDVNASILSLPEFGETGVNLSVAKYYVLTKCISQAGSLILVLLCCGISGLCRKIYYSVFISFAAIVLPILLSFTGFRAAEFFSIESILCPRSFKTAGITSIIYGVPTFIFIRKAMVRWLK